MTSHFATRLIDEEGEWIDQTNSNNTSSDISPTAGQMARLLGLAQASKLYRNLDELKHLTKFSKGGREIAWGTIGDASTSERSEEHTSELQSRGQLVCRLLLE